MLLPGFSIEDYVSLIHELRQVGYQFVPVSQLAAPIAGKVAYLRHDIDLHLTQVDIVARAEAECDVIATYYVLLTQHFNLFYPENRRTLRAIQALGHEIGLHYDLQTYPSDPKEAQDHLAWEADLLSQITGVPVNTIAMHQPFTGQADPFRQLIVYINAQYPCYTRDVTYISDSCRAWRDETLLTCFGSNPPRRLMLNTHPELWLDGTVDDRMTYLEDVVMRNGVQPHRDFFDQAVRRVWVEHIGPRLHDERECHRTSLEIFQAAPPIAPRTE